MTNWHNTETPPDHLEHRFHFEEPGTYEIALRAIGPGGEDHTQTVRTAIVRPQEETIMDIGIGLAPLPDERMRPAKALQATGINGQYFVLNTDGTIMSVQPDGSVETRSASALGAYERCTRHGNVVYFRPTADTVYAFAFAETVP